MVTESVVKFSIKPRPDYRSKKTYPKALITIPQELIRDPAFPFKDDQRLLIRIEGRRLILEELRPSRA